MAATAVASMQKLCCPLSRSRPSLAKEMSPAAKTPEKCPELFCHFDLTNVSAERARLGIIIMSAYHN